MADITLGNLYDFNKNAMNTLKPLDTFILNRQIEDIAITMLVGDKYWMLLNKELGDYSIFHIENENINWISKEVRETILNRGKIISIDKTEDGIAFEIWIKIDEECFVYYLFGYDSAIIKC